MTNTEFVQYVMEIGGQTGAMKEMVIMQGIPQHCQEIIDQEEELLKEEKENEEKGQRSIISVSGWIAAAKEIKEMFDKRGAAPV